jgi:DNA-binding transcriptional ArsR family regulator
MPRLSFPEKVKTKVEFVLSEPLDLMNAMYFTSLAGTSEGIEGWPAETRSRMAPDLLEELDFLYSFPHGDPGLMGFLGDYLWVLPETWKDVDSLIERLRELPPGMGESEEKPGIQRFAFYSACWSANEPDIEPGDAPRATLARLLKDSGSDAKAALALFDDPEQLRSRMISLIQRFYEEHYKADIPRRMPILKRALETARSMPADDPIELAKRLSGRTNSCLENVCPGPYEKLYFSPSTDMGPYVSCSAHEKTHGLIYPVRDVESVGQEAADTVRLARIYKALGDEQRLSILRMLQGREMYVQEIVERTGLHQSVVSRHLSYMHAVGLLVKRREGSMKFISINPEIVPILSTAINVLRPAPSASVN